jgi:hypothetical protein
VSALPICRSNLHALVCANRAGSTAAILRWGILDQKSVLRMAEILYTARAGLRLAFCRKVMRTRTICGMRSEPAANSILPVKITHDTMILHKRLAIALLFPLDWCVRPQPIQSMNSPPRSKPMSLMSCRMRTLLPEVQKARRTVIIACKLRDVSAVRLLSAFCPATNGKIPDVFCS